MKKINLLTKACFIFIGFVLLFFSCKKDFTSSNSESTELKLKSSPLSVNASITYFSPATGLYYPGNNVTSKLKFKNTGTQTWTFWVGYSVQNKCGIWYDVLSNSVTLSPGQTSSLQSKSWVVPSDPNVISELYAVKMAIWKTKPENGGATLLDYKQQNNSFSAFNFIDEFNSFNTIRWVKQNHTTPGFGSFLPENITTTGGSLLIKYPKNTKNGGEIYTKNPYKYKYGTFKAKIKCPQLPGTITTLFTYQGPDYGDEIDIEIWNNGSKKVEFTIYKYEISSVTHNFVYNNPNTILSFDPSNGYHEYRIDFYPDKISWWIDGVQKDYTTNQSYFPTHTMDIRVNGWWPNWTKPGWTNSNPVSTDKYAYYSWVQH